MTVLRIDDGLVSNVVLFSSCHWLSRWDVFPFAASYILLAVTILYDLHGLKLYAFITFPCILLVHIMLFLFAQWSLLLKCYLGNLRAKSIQSAQVVYVVASKNIGKNRIVKLMKSNNSGQNVNIAGNNFNNFEISFEFQKVVYGFDASVNNFVRISYPDKGKAKDFLKYEGHNKAKRVSACQEIWGLNVFDIPVPLFLDLYMEHLSAPFFVFQVLCLLLWSLDDYWYYSVFTLVMLMFFEGMLCKQRQASLMMLRSMRRPPIMLTAYRCQKWESISSELIVPGDIISLTSLPSRKSRSEPDDEVIMPCDALLVGGSCVVNEALLTGESVPQMKESITDTNCQSSDSLNLNADSMSESSWRRHVLLAGTCLLQHSPYNAEDENNAKSLKEDEFRIAPDGGCVAVVVRTGFGTVQGGLMRTILFATERINASDSLDTFYFIGVLVVFAFIASSVVLHYGLADENRNKFKLALHCIMIVTSVVPPELPMELSLAVTSSLTALSRQMVFCTEPFRIPMAGKLDLLCFDKTGTLTKDQMILRGIVAPIQLPLAIHKSEFKSLASSVELDVSTIVHPSNVPDIVITCMATCHSLIQRRDGRFLGDPLEIAAMEASQCQFEVNAKTNQSSGFRGGSLPCVIHKEKNIRCQLRKRFPFTSNLKRMSVIVEVSEAGSSAATSTVVFTKGAPEVLAEFIKNLPTNYTKTYIHHMVRGKRTLALAYKPLNNKADEDLVSSEIGRFSRDEVERDLIFLGFLVFDCDLKADSKSVIKELRQSNHKLIMITGDSTHTAADVARRLGMMKSSTKLLNLQLSKNGDSIVWTSNQGQDEQTEYVEEVFKIEQIKTLAGKYCLCVTGNSILELQGIYSSKQNDKNETDYHLVIQKLFPYVTICARFSPSQKEMVLRALNSSGGWTMMCGDGTNDVGALKAAHVGISIINDADFENKVLSQTTSTTKKGSQSSDPNDRLVRALAEIQEQEMDPTLVKLGDASIASPFTSRRTSIDAVLAVLRQGRATLVTTVQVYKILALNCLVNAYVMSALYLRGLKQGDRQLTASGLVMTAFFYFLSQAKPLQSLSSQKPPYSVFFTSVMVSIFGQFTVHLTSLIMALEICQKYSSTFDNDILSSPDGNFHPTLVSTSIYILSFSIQINNFVVNYRGHPFTQSIQENIPLWRSVQAVYLSIIIVVGGQVEPLNDLLQLSPFPSSEFQVSLIGILLFNFFASYGIEKISQRLEPKK